MILMQPKSAEEFYDCPASVRRKLIKEALQDIAENYQEMMAYCSKNGTPYKVELTVETLFQKKRRQAK